MVVSGDEAWAGDVRYITKSKSPGRRQPKCLGARLLPSIAFSTFRPVGLVTTH
jgi:hypothetical protein